MEEEEVAVREEKEACFQMSTMRRRFWERGREIDGRASVPLALAECRTSAVSPIQILPHHQPISISSALAAYSKFYDPIASPRHIWFL
jgi:hypothetical protein